MCLPVRLTQLRPALLRYRIQSCKTVVYLRQSKQLERSTKSETDAWHCYQKSILQEEQVFADIPQPQTSDGNLLALSAAFLELLSERSQQRAPAWTAKIGAAQHPIFLVEAANRMPRLRTLCEQAAPEPLRKRQIYAPPNYLMLV